MNSCSFRIGAPAGRARRRIHARFYGQRVKCACCGPALPPPGRHPLAIELAAARAGLLTIEQIAARLDDRFRLLSSGSRTALPRHQTLRASIDWSYSLLGERERLLLMRLSIFVGRWRLAAVEYVCGFDGLDDFEVLDVLAGLVKKSLVVADRQSGSEARYHLLETVREYAHEKLLDQGAGDTVRDRHLDYYLRLAERAEPHLRSHEQIAWNDRLEEEAGNLRSAMVWSEVEQVEKGLRMAWALRMVLARTRPFVPWRNH
jgi:predicted ATPase